MTSSSHETCLLCLQKNANTINFYSDTGKELNIISILSTHFWFQLDEIKVLSQNICSECWKKTESFHDFYQSIQLAHKKFETVFVKIENDPDIEDDGEICLPRHEIYQPQAVEEIFQPHQAPHDITSFEKIKNNRDAEDDESSDTSVYEVPYTNSIDTKVFDSLPKKTQDSYLKSYKRFLTWKTAENIEEDCFSEAVMLEYFHYLKSKYKPSTLNVEYSMLRTTIQEHNNVDINYPEVTTMLKNSLVGFQSHKSKIFQPDEIQRFFSEAEDIKFLDVKVMLIFLVYGSRVDTLTKVNVNDVNKHGSVFVIKVLETRGNAFRSFTVENEYAACVQKYKNLRPVNVPHDRFFLNYQKGKCTMQPIGKNKFMNAPKVIAKFLRLDNPEGYTCYSFRSESSNCGKTGELNSKEINVEQSTVSSNCKAVDTTVLDPKYLRAYDKFMRWKTNENIEKECFSEEVMLDYFHCLKNKYKPTSLNLEHSMLKTTIHRNHNVDIGYPKLRLFLKTSKFGYSPQKTVFFLPSEIQRFLCEAEDKEYLAVKVIMIFGIYGVVRTPELTKVDVKDVTEQGSVFTIKISNEKTNAIRSITVEHEHAPYVKKYKELRPENVPHSRFFINYQNRKCTVQPIGKNKFLNAPKIIANFLNLKDADSYTFHSFRTNPLKRKRGSRSSQMLHNYVQECLPTKRKVDDQSADEINLEASSESDATSRICEDVKDPVWNFLPEKSREKYVRSYENFLVWKINEKIDKNCCSEAVVVKYFNHMKTKYNPNSLWQEYSVLRTTVHKRDNVDINYPELKLFLKNNAIGFQQKRSEVLQREEILRFLSEAEDIKFLAVKVIIIFGFYGTTRADELARLEVKDVVDEDSVFAIKILDEKANVIRSFNVENEYAAYVRKYKKLRPKNVPHRRFFINYQNGKCTIQPIGVNMFRNAPKIIAKFLNLEDADNYLLRSLKREQKVRRKSKKLLGDCNVDNYIQSEQIHFKRSTEAIVTSTITSSMDTSSAASTLTIPTPFQSYHAQSHQIQPYQLMPYGASAINMRANDAFVQSDNSINEKILWGMQFNNFHNL